MAQTVLLDNGVLLRKELDQRYSQLTYCFYGTDKLCVTQYVSLQLIVVLVKFFFAPEFLVKGNYYRYIMNISSILIL